MTQVDAAVGTGTDTGTGPRRRPALARLVARPDDFAADIWGREALLTPAADLPHTFDDLFSQAAVDDLVSVQGLRTPFLRVAKDGTTLPDRDFTLGGGVGAAVGDQVSDDRLLRLFADGATMVLQGLHRTHAPILRFSQALAADLGHPVQVNAYVTPPQNKGFSDHYDVHDVFVLQIHGSKQWRVHEPVHPMPLRDQPWTDRRAAVQQAAAEPPTLDAVLEPGDCLYLPRGYLHAATALGEVSTHLTIGVHTWTRHALADEVLRTALADLAADPVVRTSLPLGADVADPADLAEHLDLVRDRLAAAVARVEDTTVAAAMRGRARAAQRAAPVRPLEQLAAVAQLQPGTELVLREHLSAEIEITTAGVRLRSRAGLLYLRPGEVAGVQRLLGWGRVSVTDLGGAGEGGGPGDGPGDGAELARRLLHHGVAVVG